MSLTSIRYTLFSHCNCMDDRTPHWVFAKHIDTLHAILTNTYNIYPHSTQLIIINIIISMELSQYPAIAWIESFGQIVLFQFLCYRLNLAGCLVSLIGWARAKMVSRVKCDLSGACVFLSSMDCELQVTSSSRHVSLEICLGNDGRKFCSIDRPTCLRIRWPVL